MSYAELALDHEELTGEGLLTMPDLRYRGPTMSLHDRVHVLRQAVNALRPHLLAGSLLRGAAFKRCASLVPLGRRPCIGLKARPYFAARGTMKQEPERLSLHCMVKWHARLRALARQCKPLTMFLQDYFPFPIDDCEPLRPRQRLPGRLLAGGLPPPPPPHGRHDPGCNRSWSPTPTHRPCHNREGPAQRRGMMCGASSPGPGCASSAGRRHATGVRCGTGESICAAAGGHRRHGAIGVPTACLLVGRGRPMSRPGTRKLAPAERRAGADTMRRWLAAGSATGAVGQAPRAAPGALAQRPRPAPETGEEPPPRRPYQRWPQVAGRSTRASTEGSEDNDDYHDGDEDMDHGAAGATTCQSPCKRAPGEGVATASSTPHDRTPPPQGVPGWAGRQEAAQPSGKRAVQPAPGPARCRPQADRAGRGAPRSQPFPPIRVPQPQGGTHTRN